MINKRLIFSKNPHLKYSDAPLNVDTSERLLPITSSRSCFAEHSRIPLTSRPAHFFLNVFWFSGGFFPSKMDYVSCSSVRNEHIFKNWLVQAKKLGEILAFVKFCPLIALWVKKLQILLTGSEINRQNLAQTNIFQSFFGQEPIRFPIQMYGKSWSA